MVRKEIVIIILFLTYSFTRYDVNVLDCAQLKSILIKVIIVEIFFFKEYTFDSSYYFCEFKIYPFKR